MDPWLVPFRYRGSTGTFGQNFLWKSGHIYVMDNHRAAAWCWAQELDPATPHALFHIDRHYDALESDLAEWLSHLPYGIPRAITTYLELKQRNADGSEPRIFRWDNYLPIYSALAAGNLAPVFFATHGDGTPPRSFPFSEVEIWDLVGNIGFHIAQADVPWIINLDLDYFYCGEEEQATRFIHDDYIDALAAEIAELDRAGKLAAITIALTATEGLTAGWRGPEELATRICAALGCHFRLPD